MSTSNTIQNVQVSFTSVASPAGAGEGIYVGHARNPVILVPNPRRTGDYNNPWDSVRLGCYYSEPGGNTILARKIEETGTGPIISNLTDHMPAMLFMPESGFFSERVNAEMLAKPFICQLRKNCGDISGNRFYTRYMRSSMSSLGGRHFSKFSGQDNERRHTIYLQFLFCIRYIRNVELRILTGNITTYTGPDVLWACVVPKETSRLFHHDFLDMVEIHPEKYGLELWYNPQAIAEVPKLNAFFSSEMRYQLRTLKLLAVGKSKEEMAKLLVPYESIFPKTGMVTVENRRDFGKQVIKRAIAELLPTPTPTPLSTTSSVTFVEFQGNGGRESVQQP